MAKWLPFPDLALARWAPASDDGLYVWRARDDDRTVEFLAFGITPMEDLHLIAQRVLATGPYLTEGDD